MSDLDRFELFACVAQTGSLTQAATLLETTKASLSKQIKRLEGDLKVDLFLRYGQRLHLTPQGKLLLEQCLRLKKELDDARSICQQFHEEPEGELHVVAFDYFVKKLIFPKLKIFLQRYPKLQLFIDTSERIPHFEREQVDLAVGFSLPAPEDIVQKKMATTRYVLCASAQYFKEKGEPKNLNDLKNHFYIGHSSRTEVNAIKLQPGHEIIINPHILLNSVSSMLECAKEGLGLVQLPLYMVQSDIDAGKLVEVLKEYQATDQGVYYYYPRYRYAQPKVRKFIDFFWSDST